MWVMAEMVHQWERNKLMRPETWEADVIILLPGVSYFVKSPELYAIAPIPISAIEAKST